MVCVHPKSAVSQLGDFIQTPNTTLQNQFSVLAFVYLLPKNTLRLHDTIIFKNIYFTWKMNEN